MGVFVFAGQCVIGPPWESKAVTTLKIGTRSSPLALWQANHVSAQLTLHHPQIQVELVPIVTEGDRLLDGPLSQSGGKGLFLKELEVALVEGRIDIAVHSMKDVTVLLPDGLHICVVLERADPRDALISTVGRELRDLPPNAVLGTSSLRRRCQLLGHRPDLKAVDMRGNVQTRLKKLERGDCHATVLAVAGLERLGMLDLATDIMSPEYSLPAVGQGIVGCETRIDDAVTNELLQPLHHERSHQCLVAERAVNRKLDGGCHHPIAAFAEHQRDGLRLRALVGKVDGSEIIFEQQSGPVENANALGENVAARLLERGAGKLLSDADLS